MAIALKLGVTDSDGSPVDLLDRTHFRVPRNGFAFAAEFGGSVTLPILCLGPTPALNWQTIAQKLEIVAPRGAGPWALASANVSLWVTNIGETQPTYFDVIGGKFEPADLYMVTPSVMAAKATLLVRPYGRGTLQSFTGLSIPGGGGRVYLSGINGDVPALARIKLTDTTGGGKKIARWYIGQHSHPLLADADLTPVGAVTAVSPGVSTADGTAKGGTMSRLTLSSSWQANSTYTGPATGKFNRRARIMARVRSSELVIGQPTGVTVTTSSGAGNIGTASITAQIVPYNGSGVTGQPSAPITASTQYLVQGGAVTLALTPLFHHDFEDQSFAPWTPGLTITTNSGTASGTITGGAAYAGSYGCQLTANSGGVAGQYGYAVLRKIAPALPTSRVLTWRGRVNPVTEVSHTTTSGGFNFVAYASITISSTSSATFGLLTKDGSNWAAYHVTNNTATPPAPSQVSSGSMTQDGSLFALAASFHYVEVTADLSSSGTVGLRLMVDGVDQGGTTLTTQGTTPVVTEFGFSAGAFSTGGANATETVYVDDVDIADGTLGTGASVSAYAYIYSWASSANATGYYLHFQQSGGVWERLDVGNVLTYTLTSLVPSGVLLNKAPPTTLPAIQPTQVRALTAISASSPAYQQGTPVQVRKGSSKWEWLDLGGANLPPMPVPQNGTIPQWILQIQGMNPSTSGTPTLDVDMVGIFDELLEVSELFDNNPPSTVVWDYDTRADGEVSCVERLAADNSVLGQATVSGPMHLGPGNCQLVLLPEVSDGGTDAVADITATANVAVDVVPRYLVSAGV